MSLPATYTVSELVAQLRLHYAQWVEQRVTLEDDLARGHLADYLGCHPEVLSEVWSAWATELALTGEDAQAAGAWLHFFFWDPRPEDH